MRKQAEIELNLFQINILLNADQKNGYQFIIDKGVICTKCEGIASKGIVVEKIFLNSLNDIKVQGTCKACNNKVTRIIEFGEDPIFYKKANDFRKSLKSNS